MKQKSTEEKKREMNPGRLGFFFWGKILYGLGIWLRKVPDNRKKKKKPHDKEGAQSGEKRWFWAKSVGLEKAGPAVYCPEENCQVTGKKGKAARKKVFLQEVGTKRTRNKRQGGGGLFQKKTQRFSPKGAGVFSDK